MPTKGAKNLQNIFEVPAWSNRQLSALHVTDHQCLRAFSRHARDMDETCDEQAVDRRGFDGSTHDSVHMSTRLYQANNLGHSHAARYLAGDGWGQ